MELESPDGGDKGVDAVSWLAHLGGVGGLHGGQLWHWLTALDLFHVVLSLAGRQTGEWDWLDGHLGALGLAGWTALGDWDLGEAHLAWALHGQVPEDGATASGSLVSLGNLGWLDHDLGAHLSLLLELRHEVGWDGGGGGGWDHPGSNLQLWLGHDALGSGSLGDDWLHEVAAQAGQLVVQLDGWDDLNLLAIGPDLIEVEPWGLEDDDTVGGLLDGGDWLARNALDDGWLASGDLDWPVIDEDLGADWVDLKFVLLQVNNGFKLVAISNWHGKDTEPVEVGDISGEDEAFLGHGRIDVIRLTVELGHVDLAMWIPGHGTCLSGEDGARDKLVGGKPDVVPDG